jgi:prolyl-tRNA synthetase
LTVHDTPDTPTIAALVDLANARALDGRADWTAADTLKNVVVTVHHPGAEDELLAIGVPGDREVDLKRLDAALAPATATLFDDFASRPDLVKGYIGPQGSKIRYLADPRIVAGTAWLTGANLPGKHATSVVAGRDFTPEGTIEAAEVRAGDPCPQCGTGELTVRRGIEIAHIFQLGRRYTDAFKVDVLGADGKPVRPTMGSYGVGLSRAVAAIAEQHHDERGLLWPAEVAPADVHVIAAGKDGQIEAALALAAELVGAGLRVLVDDRPQLSAGVKFTDAELIGIPRAVVVGRRLSEGYAELRDRRTGDRHDVRLAGIPGVLTGVVG